MDDRRPDIDAPEGRAPEDVPPDVELAALQEDPDEDDGDARLSVREAAEHEGTGTDR